MRNSSRQSIIAAVAVIITAAAFAGVARADTEGLPILPITVFQAPSYSVWLPTIITEKRLDARRGFRLKVTEKPGTAAYIDLAQGADLVCFCVAPQTFTQFVAQGAAVTLLFNVFSHTNLVAVTDPSINSVASLQDKTIAANTATGQWAVSAFLLKQAGLDLSKVKIRSAIGSGGAIAELALGRVDAILPGPVEVASLQTQTSQFHVFSIFDKAAWQAVAPGPGIPNILFGAQRKWWDNPANKDISRRFYAAVQDAAAFAVAHPEETAAIVGARTKMPKAAVLYTLTHFPEVINIRPASEFKPAIAFLTQKLMPEAGQLEHALTDAEVNAYVSDFTP
ncbi:MAG: hypothetical protein C3F11_12060 [Methylocystaceae bacterium]|nr:MAG: hypothetical protein C3F11_12060 [Methylocystaceae bacterium]